MRITDIRCLGVTFEQVVINAEPSAGFKRFGKLAIQRCVVILSSETRPVNGFDCEYSKGVAVVSA